MSFASFQAALGGFQRRPATRPSVNAAYLASLDTRCWAAFCAEMEATPFSVERGHLALLNLLRRAVETRLQEVAA